MYMYIMYITRKQNNAHVYEQNIILLSIYIIKRFSFLIQIYIIVV